MQALELTGFRREDAGKGASRRIRRQGMIPAILYGIGDLIPVIVDPKKLTRILERGENTIFQFNIEGEEKSERSVIVKELQCDPVRNDILHADLLHISMDKEIRVNVAISLVGQAKGVSVDGGILHLQKREVEIECLPNRIPEEISVDITELRVGGSIHVKDLQAAEGVRILDDPDEPVVSVTVIAPEEEAVAAEVAVEAEGEEGAPAAGKGEEKESEKKE